MLKVVKCVMIISNISKSAFGKLNRVKDLWRKGNKSAAAADGIVAITHITCTAVMLYDPWVLFRPMLIIVPYAIRYIPFISNIAVLKTVIIYGLEFIEM
jgi:hypothetical protein